MHLAPLIRDLAIILGIGGLIGLIFQRLKQPVVLGYLIAGLVIGPHTPPVQLVKDLPSIQTWAELGVIFLMFSLGLEFSFRKLASVGGSAIVTAGAEVLFFLPVGYFVGRAFGWPPMDCLFLGAMLSISSTTIIMKALEELKLKTRRFAELIFAVLIVEDLFAILLLVGLSTIALNDTVSPVALLTSALKLILVVGGWFLSGYFVVPRFMRYVGKIGSTEMLTILSLGLCLALVVFANHFHYSTALGAFIMGSILAESPVHHRIEHAMTSLRDLFGAVFFVSIGMLIDPRMLWEHRGVIGILCVVTIVGKIISTGLGALLSGQSLRNSVQVGFGLAQIGEFSFIIAGLGLSLNVTSDFLYPVGVAVSLVTTFLTPFFIKASSPFAEWLEKRLPKSLRQALDRYAAQSEARRSGQGGHRDAFRPLLRLGANGIAASVIFVAASEWLDEKAVPVLGWGVAVLLSTPFIWGMLTAVRTPERRGHQILRLFTQLLTLLWIGALSSFFFSGRYVVIVTAGVLLVLFLIFYRRLGSLYHWLEKGFLATFEMRPTSEGKEEAFKHLAPWDIHLVHEKIHPNAAIAGRTIADAALRVRHGVNIVAIQRGLRSIVTPLPQEVLLPGDDLILLGTDPQVEAVREELEAPAELASQLGTPPASYELRQARLSPASPLVGRSIRQSKIRETYRAMVVGIERAGQRVINPDSDGLLEAGDVLWIAGERARLEELMKLSGASAPLPS